MSVLVFYDLSFSELSQMNSFHYLIAYLYILRMIDDKASQHIGSFVLQP